MYRIAATLMLTLFVAASALADVPPPPGFKRVSIRHHITTDKDYPEYAFFTTTLLGEQATPVKLDAKTPLNVTIAYRVGWLVAVPKDAAKNYGSEKEFLTAVAEGKVAGQLRSKDGFAAYVQLKEADAKKPIVREYRLEKVNAKDGIVLTPVKKSKGKGTADNAPDDEFDAEAGDDSPSAAAPIGRGWVAGLFGFAAVALAGLWLARRVR